jgi:hypothetical protein
MKMHFNLCMQVVTLIVFPVRFTFEGIYTYCLYKNTLSCHRKVLADLINSKLIVN